MSPEGSITSWLGQLQAGDEAAAQKLWERYFQRLVQLARRRLQGTPGRAADAEDVALSAFASFCRNAEAGRFPQLADRDDLWRLLVVLTARKASRLTRGENALKRGGGLGPVENGDEALEQVVSREPSPEFAAEVAEEYRGLLRVLGDPDLEAVALWKMEGYTVEEIADRLDCAPRTVKRKLKLIRSLWQEEIGP